MFKRGGYSTPLDILINRLNKYIMLDLIQNHALASDISDTLREHMGSPSVFGGVRVTHLFYFCVAVFSFVCLRPVSCVPNVL